MKLNIARRDKANNFVPLVARQISRFCSVLRIPYDCLTNGIFRFDYRLWRYRVPLPIDGNPILTLPDVVASAVTISVRATQSPFGDRIFSNHSRISGGAFLNCPRSIAAAVALTAQNTSVAMSDLALQFLSVALHMGYSTTADRSSPTLTALHLANRRIDPHQNSRAETLGRSPLMASVTGRRGPPNRGGPQVLEETTASSVI
jgi:hypothetical protein